MNDTPNTNHPHRDSCVEFYRRQAEYGRTLTIRVQAALTLRKITGTTCDIDPTLRPYPPAPSTRRSQNPQASGNGQRAGATTYTPASSGSAGTPAFARQVRGSGTGSRARTVTVTVTGNWYVTVQIDGEEPVNLGAHDTSHLIGALQAALHQRRQQNPGQ